MYVFCCYIFSFFFMKGERNLITDLIFSSNNLSVSVCVCKCGGYRSMLGIFLNHLHPSFWDRVPHCTWNFPLQLDLLAIEQQQLSSSGITDILTFRMYAGVKCRSL